MADQMTVEQIAEAREAFALFDRENTGTIMIEDVSALLQSIGQPFTQEELNKFFADSDLDKNGYIDFAEFLTLLSEKINNKDDTDRELRETFRFYDVSNEGVITPCNLQYAMGRLGCKLTPEEADEMIREADLDMDGALNFEEFRRMMSMS